LLDTLRAIYGFAFQDVLEVDRIVRRITALHARVRGSTPQGEPYSALDPHLLLWVYATLIDSSLLAYETFVAPLTAADRERYYGEFRHAGPIWGIAPGAFPGSLTGLRRWMASLIERGEVHVTPQGRTVGRYVLEPPVWWMPPPAALILKWITIWLLPRPLRDGFGYSWDARRERVVRLLAAASRATVPHLPHAVRDLPSARAADRRVRRREGLRSAD
jgi:uncharacterized protein (DUF2236 family)